jgi:hypothetical protein
MEPEQKKRESKKSKMGCGSCQVVVCEECWPEFTHGLEL